MAARKPKKAVAKKKPSLLGNDPFARGAAVREAKSAPAPEAPRPVTTPELQVKQPSLRARTGSLSGRPKPGWVEQEKAAVEPRPHASSPEIAADPQRHADSPTAELLRAGPQPHASSPIVVADPQRHADSPSIVDARSHAASPAVVADPQPHAGSPTVETLAPAATALTSTSDVSVVEAIKGLVKAVRSASGLSSRATEVDRYGKDAALASSLRPLGDLLYDKYWRVQVEGAEHLPSGPFIIVANHAGALPLDGPVLHLALRRHRPELPDARWLLEDQIFHAPFVGVLANRLGAVRATPENAVRLLDEGRPLIVFPEGFHGLSKPFSERYQLRRFGRGGYVKIALRKRVPIIPAAIIGGEESMPLLAKLPGGLFGVEYLPVTLPPLPARWHLRFAPPVPLDGAPAEPEADLAWVERTNLAVRDQIEAMLTHMLQHRDRVF